MRIDRKRLAEEKKALDRDLKSIYSQSADEKMTASIDKHQMKRLFRYLIPYKTLALIVILLMFAATVADLLGPRLLQKVVDEVIPMGNSGIQLLLMITLLYAFLQLISYICRNVQTRMANKMGLKALYDLRTDLYSHVTGLSFSFYDRNSAGKVIVRIVNDVNTLSDLFTNGLVSVVSDCAIVIMTALMMIFTHLRLSIVTLLCVPFFMIGLFFLRNSMKRRWRAVRSKISNLNSYIHESITGMKVIQAFTRQKYNRRVFHTVIDDVYDSWVHAIKLNGYIQPAVQFVSVLGTALVYWYGARLLRIEGVTVGILVAFTAYLSSFWRPVMTLSNFYNQLLVAMASSERIFQMLDERPDLPDAEDAVEVERFRGEVDFKNVCFSYDRKVEVLKNVSFTVSPGECVALVGTTGSGKTTIVNLLSRFYERSAGLITIDGIDVAKIKTKSLRARIGIMLQDPQGYLDK